MRLPLAVSVVGLALASCAHAGGNGHAGRDATADGARKLVVGWRPVKGIVTARGGDPIDWYVFEVDHPCRSVAVELAMKPARPTSKLEVTIVTPRGKATSKRVGKTPGRRRGTISINDAALGHYFVGVQTIGESAATYRLLVHDASTGFECGDLPPPMPIVVLVPPEPAASPAVPSDSIGARIAEWRGYTDGRRVAYSAQIAAGFDDGVRHAVAVLLDANGEAVPGIKLQVDAYGPHRAIGTILGDAGVAPDSWAVAIAREPVPPPPLTAKVVDRWKRGGAVFVRFDRGSIDGVAAGWRGTYGGGGTLEVTQVHGIHGVARLDGASLDSVLAVTEVRLAPPSR